MKQILFYTRGGDGFGMGHLYRTTWLMEALRGLAAQSALDLPAIAVRCMDSAAARSFWAGRSEHIEYIPADPSAVATALPLPATGDTLVIDWLDSPPELLRELRSGGARLLLLDDYGQGQAEANLVLNSLLAPLEHSAAQLGKCSILSGARYIALPPALGRLLHAARGGTRSLEQLMADAVIAEPGPVRAVMVNFGGEVVHEAVELALRALANLPFRGRVIVMPADNSTEIPAELYAELRPASDDFHDLLAASDLCICAGGLALYEAAMLGVPAVAIALVPHQHETAMKLSLAGTCMYAGALESLTVTSLEFPLASLLRDEKLRAVMSARGQQQIDGLGSCRVALEILQLCGEKTEEEDC